MKGKTCCVTGHRDIAADEIAHVKDALRREIEKAVNDGFTVFLSGFAHSVDQYFAEIVLELQNKNPGLKLITVLPYRKRVDSLCQKEHTNALLDACSEVVVIREEYRPNVYSQRNRYMVEHSDRVIAVYDGREKVGIVKTIRFAHQFRKELREIPIGLILDKNRKEKVEMRTALWYNEFSTVGLTTIRLDLQKIIIHLFLKMGNRTLKGAFA